MDISRETIKSQLISRFQNLYSRRAAMEELVELYYTDYELLIEIILEICDINKFALFYTFKYIFMEMLENDSRYEYNYKHQYIKDVLKLKLMSTK